MKRSNALRAAIGATLLTCTAAMAHAGQDALEKITYWSQDLTYGLAYVITWNTAAHRAHFAETYGNFDGSYVDDGAQRVFTLDVPLVLTYQIADCNGNPMTQHDVTTQLVIRTVSGEPDKGDSAVVPIGYDQDVDGCTPGLTVHYGTTTDAGIPLLRRAASLRPPMDDLTSGTQVAGLAENPIDAYGDLPVLAAQVATLGRDHVTFQGTGHRFPTTLTPDGWLVIDFGSFKRAYTRVERQRETGGEIWFGAEWIAGKPASIELSTVVAPTEDAGFGDLAESSRQWFDGLFQYDVPTTFELYRDHTGSQVVAPGGGAPASQSPLTWSRTGDALRISRADSSGTYVHTWQPIANHGRNHFVIENEEIYINGVDAGPAFAPRVNWYVDQGKAAEPPVAKPSVTTGKAR